MPEKRISLSADTVAAFVKWINEQQEIKHGSDTTRI
jgi:hypothetical protein